jgi:hypothetical protein
LRQALACRAPASHAEIRYTIHFRQALQRPAPVIMLASASSFLPALRECTTLRQALACRAPASHAEIRYTIHFRQALQRPAPATTLASASSFLPAFCESNPLRQALACRAPEANNAYLPITSVNLIRLPRTNPRNHLTNIHLYSILDTSKLFMTIH